MTELTAYDLTENRLVTAYDVMFGKSKTHEVIQPSEAVVKIRDDLDRAIKEGVISDEKITNTRDEISQALNDCDQSKKEAVRQVELAIKDIVKTLYKRKNEVTEKICNSFVEKRKIIENHQAEWEQRQKYANDLLKLSKSSDDDEILNSSKYIYEGIDKLSKAIKTNSVKVIKFIDTKLKIESESKDKKNCTISFEVFKENIKRYLDYENSKVIEFKC